MDSTPDSLGAAQASGGDLRAVPLTQLPTGAQARIVRVVHDPDGHWRKLSALGVVPGAALYLLQRFPTFTLRIGMSTLAVDTQLANLIYVEPLEGR